jgi:heme/copper-type cytochrome/quinol oxidase subunit 4
VVTVSWAAYWLIFVILYLGIGVVLTLHVFLSMSLQEQRAWTFLHWFVGFFAWPVILLDYWDHR